MKRQTKGNFLYYAAIRRAKPATSRARERASPSRVSFPKKRRRRLVDGPVLTAEGRGGAHEFPPQHVFPEEFGFWGFQDLSG